jgi:hypothetical protein
MDDVTSVSASSNQTLIVKADGSLWGCGGLSGQFGFNTSSNTPKMIVSPATAAPTPNISLSSVKDTLRVGETLTFGYSLFPTGSQTTVTFSSDDPSIAEVNATTGIVKAKKRGVTYINVTTTEGKMDWCKVTVLANPEKQTVNTSSAGYATFYSSESAYTLPTGLSAQTVTGISNGKLSFRTLSDNVVPSGTAVLLTNNKAQSSSFTLTPTESTIEYNGTNLLHGSDETTTTTGDGYHYKLSYGPKTDSKLKDVFGWYWGANNGGAFQIEGHKAWLVVPKQNGTRAYTVDGEPSSIEEFEDGGLKNDDSVYDLQGRRVNGSQLNKGVYIKNGKKVINK